MPPNTRVRPPAANRGPEASRAATATASIAPAEPDELTRAARRRWARALIRRASRPLPAYGSQAWNALPLDADERVAATVAAAECWARHGDDLARRLHDEIADLRAAREAVEAEAFASVAQAVRAHATSPSHADLAARRGEHGEAERAALRVLTLPETLAAARGGAS